MDDAEGRGAMTLALSLRHGDCGGVRRSCTETRRSVFSCLSAVRCVIFLFCTVEGVATERTVLPSVHRISETFYVAFRS